MPPSDVDLEVHGRLRRLGPVDRQRRARDVEAAGDADPLAVAAACRAGRSSRTPRTRSRHSRAPLLVIRNSFSVFVNGGRRFVRRNSIGSMPTSSASSSIEHLDGVARVDRAVAAHRAAGRLVRVDAPAAVAEVRDPVRAHAQHAVVVGRDDAERAPRAAVDEGVELERRELAVRVERRRHRRARRDAGRGS